MSNGEFCCAIGVCCPPDSVERRNALVNELAYGIGADAAEPTLGLIADWLIANVDMAPKGTLNLEQVAAMAKRGA